jgi:DNA-directed RNA polymerase subunit M/transcription elongation factor TFIIS
MDIKLKIKILKMLCHYLNNKNNIKLFYNCLTSVDNIDFAFECSGYFKNLTYQDIDKQLDGIDLLYKKVEQGFLIWNDSSFETLMKIEKEEDEFLETPLEVAEGAIKCKCGSERVFSFSKQTRGGDESTTVFALCSTCKSKWVL